MNFYPVSNYVKVKPVEEKKQETLVALPEGYQPRNANQELKVCELLASGEACRLKVDTGTNIVVVANMIQKINFDGETHFIVAENAIIGYLAGL
jgi:co-chaperonin GroES (HSP10)